MSDLIKRDAVINALLVEFPQINVPLVQMALARVSAVDAVEVVRCRDCEHLRIYDGASLYATCSKTGTTFYQKTHSLFALDAKTHFCSLGERSEC